MFYPEDRVSKFCREVNVSSCENTWYFNRNGLKVNIAMRTIVHGATYKKIYVFMLAAFRT
jgi:hypothetical protein